jgi:phage repressor protein C with HTH and peptisase S24 domain
LTLELVGGIILVVSVFLYLFFSRYSIGRIRENSMFPTLKPGQIVAVDRRFKIIKQQIYAFESPIPYSERVLVKRLKKYALNGYCWFEGDNPKESRDSRHFGFIAEHDIVGEVVPLKKALLEMWRIRS